MQSTTDVRAFLAEAGEAVDQTLAEWADRVRGDVPGRVGDAMAYALEGPGKRFRPALVMAVYRELGGAGDIGELATAFEVVHTYSLVHDDLPCMDDDELRRGRPTAHCAFDVPTATEAGYRMVPLAGRVLAAGARRLGLGEDSLRAIGGELFDGAGGRGMVGGQFLDLAAEGRDVSLDALREIHRRKTGALITASAVAGALAAQADLPRVEAIRRYGEEIGLAFQIADDVLDATATSNELGKTAGKDARQNKATFASAMGLEAAREEARACVARSVARLDDAGIASGLLGGLAAFIVERRS